MPLALPKFRRGFVGPPTALAAALLALAVGAAYHNAISTPFVFDDQFAVVENPSIRHLARMGEVLSPPPYAAGAAGRPLVNLTLAVNYALGGLDARGYHAFNLALHFLAALTLFGIVRRTLNTTKSVSAKSIAAKLVFAQGASRKPGGFRHVAEAARLSSDAQELTTSSLERSAWPSQQRPAFTAFFIALVWSLHPLLTESVTGVIQRDEVLGGLFYLLTLYCFIRSAEAGSKRWAVLSFLACLLGVASKEIIVSAPLIVFAYDRTFVAGTFRAAWSRRRGFYLGLAATWLPLAWLMLGSRQRGGTVGFGLGVTGWEYLLTQCRAIILYLKLSFWPHPLVIDYGTDLVRHLSEVVLQGIALLLLAALTIAGLVRRSAAGFLGACFFAILAPSSSVVPLVSQPIAEHRMYLPLAAIVVLAIAGLSAWERARRPRGAWPPSLLLWPLVALGLGTLTVRRNADYRSEIILTRGALAANPRNDRAYLNLGTFASRQGKRDEAIDDYQKALQLNPGAADTQFDLATVLDQAGRGGEAIDHFREAVRLRPAYPVAQYHLGLALAKAGREEESLGPLEEARRLQPNSSAVRARLAEVHRDLGNARAQAGRMQEAVVQYEMALRFEPGFAQVHNNLANVLSQLGRPAEAIAHYEAAVRVQPDYAEAHYNLGIELLGAGRVEEAKAQLTEAVRLRPGDEQARRDLARVEALGGK